MKKYYVAWSRVLGGDVPDNWEEDPAYDIYEAEDKEEALEEFLDDEESNLREVNAVRIDGRDYYHIDGKAEFEYEYEGKMVTLEIEMREAE